MIIQLSGKKQVGKNTVGKLIRIIDHYINKSHYKNPYDIIDIILSKLNNNTFINSKFIEKQFSYKLKQICSIILNCDINKFEDTDFKDSINFLGITNRQLLETVGTELFRNQLYFDIWVDSLMQDYNYYIDYYIDGWQDNWIITDWRFPNEDVSIKYKDIDKVIKIRINRELNDTNIHISNIALDNYNFDYIIDNNGTFEELVLQVIEIMLNEKIIRNNKK